LRNEVQREREIALGFDRQLASRDLVIVVGFLPSCSPARPGRRCHTGSISAERRAPPPAPGQQCDSKTFIHRTKWQQTNIYYNHALKRHCDNDNGKCYKYLCITSNQPDTKSNPDPKLTLTNRQSEALIISTAYRQLSHHIGMRRRR